MILVLGEALIDLTVAADGSLAAHLGGGPYNAARALGRLDVPVGYLGRLSTDAFGGRLRAQLLADGVSLDATISTPEPTTLALAELDASGAATYRFYLDGTSVPGLGAAEALAAVPSTVSAVHVGTLALVCEPLASTAEVVTRQVGGRALLFVDPNVRPAVIRDPVGYRERLWRILAAADVVKVSDDDVRWLFPQDEPRAAGRRILGLGAGVVLVTLGATGVIVIGRDFEADVPAPTVEVVDTIGAGDCFGAGVLAWWHHNGQPDLRAESAAVAASQYGVLVAAAVCARAGAEPPRRSEVG